MRRILTLLLIVLAVFTCWLIWVTGEKTNQRNEIDQAQGEAQVGGDFLLTDQNGKLVRAADFRGRVMLVFFGFTRCPDVCPVAVASMSKAMELLGGQADQVAPIFITVDPEHDTPAALHDFLANFDKRMIGLTGTPEQIKQVTEAYKVYSAKAPQPGNGADYGVDHSAFIYVMGKDGKFIKVLQNNAGAEEIARAVKSVLE